MICEDTPSSLMGHTQRNHMHFIPHSTFTVNADNCISWNIPAIKDFLGVTGEFNELLSILTFILRTISTRVTQYLNHKFWNDGHLRNLVAMLKEMVLLTTYHKMTNQTGYDQWTPAFLPLKLKEVMVA